MCGIFGWQWQQDKLPSRETRVRLATALGLFNDNRGGKSWGMAALPQIPTAKGITRFRGLGHIAGEGSLLASYYSVLAHTRAPTIGAVTVENAHPYVFGNIVGAHNGVVSNWKELEDEFPERKKFEVDSMHIFANLGEGKDLSNIDAWGAIEWMDDREPDRIYLCRISSSGSLDIVQTKHGVVWSSDGDHLKRSLSAAGLVAEKPYQVPESGVLFARAGTLWDGERKLPLMPWKSRGYTNGNFFGRTDEDDGEREAWWNNPSSKDWSKSRKGRKKDKDNAANTTIESKPDDVCQGERCGSPVVDGMCTVLFDETCTGASKYLEQQAMATTDKEQHVSGSIGKADELRKAMCEHCKDGGEVDEQGWHRIPWPEGSKSNSTFTYRLCKAPEPEVLAQWEQLRVLYPNATVGLQRDKSGFVVRLNGVQQPKPLKLPLLPAAADPWPDCLTGPSCGTKIHTSVVKSQQGLCASCLAKKRLAESASRAHTTTVDCACGLKTTHTSGVCIACYTTELRKARAEAAGGKVDSGPASTTIAPPSTIVVDESVPANQLPVVP